MKLRYSILMCIAGILAASCDISTLNVNDYNEEGLKVTADLQSQIDELKKTTIATIQGQITSINTSIESLKKMDTELQGYIEALEDALDDMDQTQYERQDEIDAIKEQIELLKKADEDLLAKIDDLQDYVSSELNAQEDWANATFATLAEQEELGETLAAIEERVTVCEEKFDGLEARITEAYKKAISDAIAQCETDMQSWVNDKLTGYYTVAAAEAKLAELESQYKDGDKDIQDRIDAQKAALTTAEADLKTAYTEAIKTSITELEGTLNTQIATDIATATTTLNTAITGINTEITNIKARLDAIEAKVKTILSRIQSIAVVPTYSDGSVKVENSASQVITFDVMPAGVLDSLVNKGSADLASNFKFALTKTRTKGDTSGEPSLPISKAAVNAAGQLELTADATKLGDEFFAGTQTLSASLVIDTKDGATSKSSEYFALYFYVAPPQPLLSGEFSVSATKKVQFTRGNLYWNGKEWGLETSQTDYPTEWSTSHVGHLFWTKDAANSYAETYNDGTCTKTDKFFADGSDADHSLTIEGQSGLYALSKDEWTYLLSTRGTGDTYFKIGVTVGTATNCLVIAPDGYTGTIAGSYDAAAWAKAEAEGLVCLPAAGYRSGLELYAAGSFGDYWSATPDGDDKDNACCLNFGGTNVDPSECLGREYGCSVRLVYSESIAVTGVKMDEDSATISPGSTKTLTYTVDPAGAKVESAVWTSSDSSVATVDQDGIVTGVDVGTATITIIINGTHIATCEVTVSAPIYTEGGYSGAGIKIGNTWWAPVNCGYSSTYTYGLLYQWGRKYGQPFENGKMTPTAMAKSDDTAANSGKFGKYDSSTNNWFSGDVDNTLWNGGSKGASDPCPTGWRVPTYDELNALIANKSGWTINDGQNGYWFSGGTAYSESVPRVFLPAAGCRGLVYGSVASRGENGTYWSSSVNDNQSSSLYFSDGHAELTSVYRALGYSVRCVKE